jgi:dipeptidyl aminopeptidase/acylaminoacyl peptidase
MPNVMSKEEIEKRQIEILYFIYQNKVVLIRHIEKMFFNTYERTQKYMQNLEKCGYLKSIRIHLTAEKAFYLSYKAIIELRQKGLDLDRYKVNPRELEHDLRVIDILIYFIKNYKGLKSYKTDYFLRKERSKDQQRYRIPDFTIEDEEGTSLVEYQASPKNKQQILAYAEDYKSYWPGYSIIFVVPPTRVKTYKEVFEGNLDHYHICTFDEEKGLTIVHEG